LDVQRAIRLARKKLGADRKVAVLGFSAGGHVAASAGVHGQALVGHPGDGCSVFSPRPDALVLCYPVISATAKGHQGSIEMLCGRDEHLRDFFCLEKQAGPSTPPSFLWHTADDAVVPVENALYFAEVLSRLKIAFALHIFPHGVHGLGLGEAQPDTRCWTDMAITWLRRALAGAPKA
jgi:acetyl esterase/lipase